MSIQTEIYYWSEPWPGHISLKIWDIDSPEFGYYISSNYTQHLLDCLQSKSYMDYIKCFHNELVQYGPQCYKIKLPTFNININSILNNDLEFLNEEYSLTTHNCAHLVARVIREIGYTHNLAIEQQNLLKPSQVVSYTYAIRTGVYKVTTIEYALSCIKDDIIQLSILADELLRRGHKNAAECTRILSGGINKQLNEWIFSEDKNLDSWRRLQQSISKLISEADPILSEHRGYKKIIGNILLGILMLGIIYAISILIKGLATGNYLFFHETKTSQTAKRMAKVAGLVTNIPVEIKEKEHKHKIAKHVHFDEITYVQPIDFKEEKNRPQKIEVKV